MPVYSESFAFGTDRLAIFSFSLSGCYFFHSRVYHAYIDLNAELFLRSGMPLKIFSISRQQTFEITLRVLQTLTVDMSRNPR